tara:strand:+ start:218 stop:739 length:522 start_codon:yes stop_codon:yes gene_type:complete
MENPFKHPTTEVSEKATIGSNTKIWSHTQIRENSTIGNNCILGKNVYIDHDVKIGHNVKIQNNSSIYHGTEIQDGVFIGPHVCLTNDKNPRAINENEEIKTEDDWEVGKILIKKGASLGAGTIVLPNTTIGEFAMIGSGSIVTKDIPDYGLAYGNPAKLIGYVDKSGKKVRDA